MKQLYPILLFNIFQTRLVAQTFELGLAVNKTHLWQGDGYVNSVFHKDGLGISLMARYQNPVTFFLFRNNESGFEYNRSEIGISEHTSPGGAGGDYTRIRYRTFSFTLNNYLVNFGTVSKGFQFSLGPHFNYKLHTESEGYFTKQQIGWDTARGTYKFTYNWHNLDGTNNRYINRFNFGLCMGIGFRPFKIGSSTFRSRYDICASVNSEINNGMYFDYLRQKFTLSLVWGNMDTKKILERKQLKDNDRKIRKNAKEIKKAERNTRLSGIHSILDKNLEFGAGINLYQTHFRYNMTGPTALPGFGLGARIWQWGNRKYLPAVSVNFQQLNTNINLWLFAAGVTMMEGKIQRNSLSVGVFPLKCLLFQKRLDIRLGLNMDYLVAEKTSGVYSAQDFVNNTYVQMLLKSDVLKFQQKTSLGPTITMAAPIVRKQLYCLKWRFTTTWNFKDLIVNAYRGDGIRSQAELVYCQPFNWKRSF